MRGGGGGGEGGEELQKSTKHENENNMYEACTHMLSPFLWTDKRCYFCAYQATLHSVCLCCFSGKHLKSKSLWRPPNGILTNFNNRIFIHFFFLVLVLWCDC